MSKFVVAAKITDVAQNATKCVSTEDKEVTLVNLNGQFFALDNLCTHEGAPLCEGSIEGEEIECPWHLGRFNIKTGKATELPAEKDLRTYPIRINGDDIEIEI